MNAGVVASAAPLRRVLLACNIYISEGRNQELVAHLQQVARTAAAPTVTLVASFADPDYNRTSITLASPDAALLARAARDVAAAALPRVDLTRHRAAHPRLGAVDHVSVHPLGMLEAEAVGLRSAEAATAAAAAAAAAEAAAGAAAARGNRERRALGPLAAAALCARLVGASLAAHPCDLPVFYYGGASSVAAAERSAGWRDAADAEGGEEARGGSSTSKDDGGADEDEDDAGAKWAPRVHLADLRRRMGYFAPTVRSSDQQPPSAGSRAASVATTTTTTTAASAAAAGCPPAAAAAAASLPPPNNNQTLWEGVPPGLGRSQRDDASGQVLARPPRAEPLSPPPDERASPAAADPQRGVCLVGSGAWVVNLNAPLLVPAGGGRAGAAGAAGAARRVARRVSERGGGLRGVQAMALDKRPAAAAAAGGGAGGSGGASAKEQEALPLFTGDYVAAERDGVVLARPPSALAAASGGGGAGGGVAPAAAPAPGGSFAAPAPAASAPAPMSIVEVACNLLSPDAGGGAEAVAREIARLAAEEGLAPAGAAYRIGASPEELVARWQTAQR